MIDLCLHAQSSKLAMYEYNNEHYFNAFIMVFVDEWNVEDVEIYTHTYFFSCDERKRRM